MSMHDKNRIPRPSRLAVIEKCHVCDGQTDRHTDRQTVRQTDTQTENRHKLFLSLTFIDMTHVNFLFHRLLVSETQTDRQTDRQDKFVKDIYIYRYISITILSCLSVWLCLTN